jgi:hypothetical protein
MFKNLDRVALASWTAFASLTAVAGFAAPQLAHAQMPAMAAAAVMENAPDFREFEGYALYSADGQRVASVYQIGTDGDAHIVLDARVLQVPGSTLSVNGGRLTTSLTAQQLMTSR